MSFQMSEFRVVKSSDPDNLKGLQTAAQLNRRRGLFLLANGLLLLALLSGIVVLLVPGGISKVDIGLLLSAIFALPPLVLAFSNAALGLALKYAVRGGFDRAAPHARMQDMTSAISQRTAIVMTLHNDPVEQALHRLKLIRTSLESTGEGGHFAYFILSDTSDPVLAKREDVLVYDWNKSLPDFAPVTYRRRLVNAGYKAGNLADFCRNWGDQFDFIVPLDSASFMTGPAILDMVRIMQAHPKIGILQALAIHAPIRTVYSRFRGFVARVTQHITALGEAWWQGDCADYRGRNAILRLKPFYLHCRMPHLPGKAPFGGAVMLHERIEAAMMQRAGFEVRALPVELNQYEDHAISIYDDLRRSRTALQGLWQLPRFIGDSGFADVYRVNWGMMLLRGATPIFITLAILLIGLTPFEGYDLTRDIPGVVAKFVYFAVLGIVLAPLLFGLVDTVLSARRTASFGGYIRVLLSGVLSAALELILLPPLALHGMVALVASLLSGLDNHVAIAGEKPVPPRSTAFRSFWPATLYGVDLLLLILLGSPSFAAWTLPITIGYVVSVPVVAVLSSPASYRLVARIGVFGVPEIYDPPREIVQLVAQARDANVDRAA